MSTWEATAPHPVFVGGTGRSGTTLTARLVGKHPDYHMIPIEVRFLVDRHGLADLLQGRTTMDRFRKQMTGPWFYREFPNGETRGLHRVMDRPVVESALTAFAREWADDPWTASAGLLQTLLDPLAMSAGAKTWVEMTPRNVHVGWVLAHLIPNVRLIHTMRDGRDVACSVVPLMWGPSDVDEALEWWAQGLRDAHSACASLTPSQYLVVQYEDLVARKRDETYARILSFVGVTDHPAMSQFFAQRVSAERAPIGRWRDDLPPDRHLAFCTRYEELLAALRTEGVPCPG